MLRLDPHVHTVYSGDSTITLDHLRLALQRTLSWIAVTDHNNVQGGLKALRTLGNHIIAGVELSTKEGHLLLLGIGDRHEAKEVLRLRDRSIFEALDLAKDMNLVAVLAHPLERFRHGVSKRILLEVLRKAPANLAIEVLNASSLPLSFRRRRLLEEILRLHSWKLVLAGSDAHIPQTIGYAYVTFHEDPGDPLEALLDCREISIGGQYIPLSMRILTAYAQLRLKIRRLRLSSSKLCTSSVSITPF